MSLKRQLSDNEKQKVLDHHGRRCFIDGEPITEEEPIEFHHIIPFSEDGPTNLDNIAPVCKRHHLTIGTMSLQEYRDKLELDKFFEGGEPKYLGDLIIHKKGRCGDKFKFESGRTDITIFFKDWQKTYPLFICPTTGWRYFYGIIPPENIENDKDLQPRALRGSSIWALYRHFKTNTQISPSICRIDDGGSFLLFDGQHKAAAQIWAGRPSVECKVYLHPDPRLLNETNLAAHGPLRQMSFYSHELGIKFAEIFGRDWTEYMDTEGKKSEIGFFNFLVRIRNRSKAQAKNEFCLAMYNEIINDPVNKLSSYLSEKQRGRKQPLTHARLVKAFFQNMLFPPPINEEFETDTDFRKDEKNNIINLMNIIVEEGLEGKWDPERNDSDHKRSERIFSAGAVRAWVILLKDTINTHLKHYSDEDRQRFIYCRIHNNEFMYFRQFVKKIFSHKIWDDPDPSGEITARLAKDDASTAKALFDENGLTVQWILGM